MTDITTPAKDQPRPWEPGFFAALRSGSSAAAAARLAGIHPTTVYSRASSNPAFLQRYEATRLAVGRVVRRDAARGRWKRAGRTAFWKRWLKPPT